MGRKFNIEMLIDRISINQYFIVGAAQVQRLIAVRDLLTHSCAIYCSERCVCVSIRMCVHSHYSVQCYYVCQT